MGEYDRIFLWRPTARECPGSKRMLHRWGIRCLFIIRVPAKYQHLVQPLRVLPTTDLSISRIWRRRYSVSTGTPAPDYMKGTVFLGANKNAPRRYFWGARDHTDEVIDLGRTIIRDSLVYIRNYYPHLPIIQRHKYMDLSDIMQLIRKDQKEGKLNALQSSVVNGHRAAESLFNIKQDPWEANDLATLPAYQGILKELRNANRDAILKNRDVMFAPEYVLSKTDQSDTLYKFRLDQKQVSG
jgi:hypothetical protein